MRPTNMELIELTLIERLHVVSSFSIDHLDWLELILNRMIDPQEGRCVQEPIEAAIALRKVIMSLN
ncbi:MAG: hypothetical protein WC647_01730 [Desulfomonilaceae bacterium]